MAAKKRVLIIEDNPDIQDIYNVWFKEAGYEVHFSNNGLTGITDLSSGIKANVILLDIMTPEMNGFEFLKAYRDNTSLNIPVIVVSNLAQDSDKEKAMEAGASMYLVKSDYEGPDLVEKVDEFLENQLTHPSSTENTN